MGNARTGAFWSRACWVAGMAFTCVMLLAPIPAWAQDSFYVRQPEVEKGKTEIEDHSAVLTGNATEDLRQATKSKARMG